jgi:hypothetical protein|tara:strand:- start:119 stop:328 length:210 start_codon:yes stop_codon:yes gene_type:complete
MTSNDRGQKYFEAHKRWISKAISFKGQVDEFKWDFVDSLSDQIQKGIPLTGRQFKSLKRVAIKLSYMAA